MTVEGWLTDGQAACLASEARAVAPGGRIVEIGSFRGRSTIVLARAADPAVEVVAIDPHLGRDRAPQETTEDPAAGASDHAAFVANLRAAGVGNRVRHLRMTSEAALDALPGPVDLLWVDGAHGFRFASLDLRRWGARVADGGVMLVHDSFSSVGVTLALLRTTVFGARWRYAGRVGSLAVFRRLPVRRRRNAARQLAQLPWFVRNVLVKALILARLRPVARVVLGHREGPWPY
jgi:predicted O-methyltransferase YrrM